MGRKRYKRKKKNAYNKLKEEPPVMKEKKEEEFFTQQRPKVGNFLECLDIIDNSSAEDRVLMQAEVNLIYECRICRAFFRDFPQFYFHKTQVCSETVK
ncbi:hypothetical protein C0J52_05666 [Blattella germanica]|nr:hypothetical protein C0J52_05666 [Blattella germanica]